MVMGMGTLLGDKNPVALTGVSPQSRKRKGP
jgi:hypothetical protein